MTSRLSRKFATNKHTETAGILYEEVDAEGPIFHVRLARLGGSNRKYSERINELMKPFRRMKQEDIPFKTREKLYLQAFCETVVLPNTWESCSKDDEGQDKWTPGIEDPATGTLLPATAVNYQKVLEQLPELSDRLLNEATLFDNYRQEALEAESKNS